MKSNEEVAALLDEIADLLEIDGANPFRVRAYRNAARTVRELQEEASDVKLTKLPGIGADLAGKIQELCEFGTTDVLDEARKKLPRDIRKLLTVNNLGPKRVKVLHEALHIETVEDLKRAVDAGALAKVPGLGATLEKKLKEALAHVGQGVALADGRFPLSVAERVANDFTARLRAMPGVARVEAAGSLRRRKSTVGDLDILVCADHDRRGGIISDFTRFPGVVEVLANGNTRGSVKLDIGLQVDLRVVELDEYGAALLYFTGNKNHSIELRAAAIKLGLKLNEYGVWRGEERIAGETEESMYAALGWQFLPPEKRER